MVVPLLTLLDWQDLLDQRVFKLALIILLKAVDLPYTNESGVNLNWQTTADINKTCTNIHGTSQHCYYVNSTYGLCTTAWRITPKIHPAT